MDQITFIYPILLNVFLNQNKSEFDSRSEMPRGRPQRYIIIDPFAAYQNQKHLYWSSM